MNNQRLLSRYVLSLAYILTFSISGQAFAGIPFSEQQVSTIFVDRNIYSISANDWHLNEVPAVVAFHSLNSFRGVTLDPKSADFYLKFTRDFRDYTSSYTNSVIMKAEIIERSTGLVRIQVLHRTGDITWSGHNFKEEYLKILKELDTLLKVELTGINSKQLNGDLRYGGLLEANDQFPFDSDTFKYTENKHVLYVKTNDPSLAQKLSDLIQNSQNQAKVFMGIKPTGSSDHALIKFVVLLDQKREVLFPEK